MSEAKILVLPSSSQIAFVDRNPTIEELEALRLLMSTFLDGSGGFRPKEKIRKQLGVSTLPAWRDFERVLALVVKGTTTESKSAYDILIPTKSAKYAGISCKMRGHDAFKMAQKEKRLYIEVTNAATQLKRAAGDNWFNSPELAGERLLRKIKNDYFGKNISKIFDTKRTVTVHWAWDIQDQKYIFELFTLKRPICDPEDVVTWYVRKDKSGEPSALVGEDASGAKLIEWYPRNGQLKYYPLIENEVSWRSGILNLEKKTPVEFRDLLLKKVFTYFNIEILFNHK